MRHQQSCSSSLNRRRDKKRGGQREKGNHTSTMPVLFQCRPEKKSEGPRPLTFLATTEKDGEKKNEKGKGAASRMNSPEQFSGLYRKKIEEKPATSTGRGSMTIRKGGKKEKSRGQRGENLHDDITVEEEGERGLKYLQSNEGTIRGEEKQPAFGIFFDATC